MNVYRQHLSLKLMWEGLRNFCSVRRICEMREFRALQIFVSGEECHFPTLFIGNENALDCGYPSFPNIVLNDGKSGSTQKMEQFSFIE